MRAEDATTLPPALRGDAAALSERARDEIKSLSRPDPRRFLDEVALSWAVIAGAIWLAVHLDSLWADALAVFVIATRQNVLGLLVHDQCHYNGLRSARGDLIANLFCAYPLLVLTVEGYAQVHLAHHRNYFGDKDPDFARKSGEDWAFPMPLGRFLRMVAADVAGLNVIRLVRGKRLAGETGETQKFKRLGDIPRWVRPAFLAAVAAVITAGGWWPEFLLYWMLPLLTVFQLFVRWGAICEHKYNLPGAAVTESTPLILLRPWERFLLPNLNFTLHAYHHFFPFVPFARLPAVHAIFEREGLVDDGNVFHGYGAYLRSLILPIGATADEHLVYGR